MYYAFTTKYTTLSNMLKNEVHIAQTPTSMTGNVVFDRKCLALWDTGSVCTVVTQKVVDDLKLKPVSFGKLSGANGEYTTPFYYVNILLPGQIHIPNLLVPLGQLSGCDLLIGMDIMGKGDFAVSNFGNETMFTFRMPSKQGVDYAKQASIENVIGQKHGGGSGGGKKKRR